MVESVSLIQTAQTDTSGKNDRRFVVEISNYGAVD